ncbi:MAG: hypothetical protein FWF84_03700 [Kiritimatiellaeota bacterium]|nr:hypothetical protein [Kiritimatiellota bacterium]
MKKIMAAIVLAAVTVAAAEPIARFALTEYLGTAWTNECLTYAVDEAVAAALKAGAVCKGDDGAEVPWQLSADGKSVRFIAALPAFGKSAYTFTAGQPSAKTALTVTETQEYVEIANAPPGGRISKALKDGAGPIVAWRLSDGTWAGGSSFAPMRKIESYSVGIVEQGAVLAKVEAVATFEGGGSWKVTAELIDGEPSFKIRETFDGSQGSTGLLTCDEKSIEHRSEDLCHLGTFTLRFDNGLDPDWFLFRAGGEFPLRGKGTHLGQILSWPLTYTPENDKALRFYLQPWVWWQGSLARGHFFTLMNYGKNTALSMITSDTVAWVDPSIPWAERATPAGWLKYGDDGKALTMDFQVKRGEREYALSVLRVDPILEDLWDVSSIEIPHPDDSNDVPPTIIPLFHGRPWGEYPRYHRAPLSEATGMRLTHYPLTQVKDLILEWPESEESRIRPRLFLSPEEIAAFRARLTEEDMKTWVKGAFNYTTDQLIGMSYDRIIPAYLAAPTEANALRFYESTKPVQDYVNELLHLTGGTISLGVAPHIRGCITTAAYGMDVWLSLPQVTEADRARIRAQMAFIAYVVNSEEYFSLPRGYAGGFVGMKSIVGLNQLATGALLPDHPMSPSWTDNGMSFLQSYIIDAWENEEGNFSGQRIEAPHYGLISCDIALAALTMRNRLGYPNDLYTDKVKNGCAWFAKVSTPRDPRFVNRRHIPATGNSYHFEPSGLFGTMAYIYRDNDPAFSAAMQWMNAEQGNELDPGVGGFYDGFAGSRRVFSDHGLPAKAPDWTSEHLLDNGVVLRSRYATEDESYLYMTAGKGSMPVNHWDQEQGGISTAFLRGTPIIDDFGYTGCAPEEDTSMLTLRRAGGVMDIEQFVATPRYDYARGTRPSGWVREIMIVKHAVEATPDFFVIRDTLAEKEPATWRMWLTPEFEEVLDSANNPVQLEAGIVDLTDTGSVMKSYGNRTTRVYLPKKPADAVVSTEPKTRATPGMDSRGLYMGRKTNIWTGLIVTSKAFDSLLAVVYTTKDGEAEPVVSFADDGTLTVEHAGKKDVIRFTADGVAVE